VGSAAARPAHGWFVERAREPTRAGVRRILAGAREAWEDLEHHLAESYRLTGSFHFMYGARYGWALRFRRGGRLVVAMYPNRGRFTAQVVLGRAQVEAASSMRLPRSVAAALRAATDYPEGRWLFIPVRSRKGAAELRPLLALKLSRPQRGARN
jgi:hypothetical protein